MPIIQSCSNPTNMKHTIIDTYKSYGKRCNANICIHDNLYTASSTNQSTPLWLLYFRFWDYFATLGWMLNVQLINVYAIVIVPAQFI